MSRPRAYPVYYPVYTPPVVVSSPTYVSYPTYVSSPTYVAPEATTQTPAVAGQNVAQVGVPAAMNTSEESLEPVFSLPPDQLMQMMSDGTRLFRGGKYDQAADLFLRAATADPQNVDARLAYAVARFATGDYELAASALRQGIRTFPDVVNSVLDVRDAYGNVEDFDRHYQRLTDRLQNRPDDPDALLVLGFLYHFVGDREHAAEVFGYIGAQAQADAEIADVFLNAKPLSQPTAAPDQKSLAAVPRADTASVGQ